MDIEVEYKNQNGHLSTRHYEMSKLAFAKHMAIAGQRFSPAPQKVLRAVGMFLHYLAYLNSDSFQRDKFSEPPARLSNPTEKGHFSNIAGTAIADFLSKRIDDSLFTVNYEAAMRMRGMRVGRIGRPDLMAYSQYASFAIEAKGYSKRTISDEEMQDHKDQSRTGGIPVNFSIACVSYNLYDRVKCKYHDPLNPDIPYDSDSLIQLTRKYYNGLSGFLDEEVFSFHTIEIGNEEFYSIKFSRRFLKNYLLGDKYFRFMHFHDFYEEFRPQIIIPKDVKSLAETGLTQKSKPFIFENDKEQLMYVDNDRVGLQVRYSW